MLTVFRQLNDPDHIYFTTPGYFEQVLQNRGLSKDDVLSQEVSLETMMLLADNKSKVFITCLYKPE